MPTAPLSLDLTDNAYGENMQIRSLQQSDYAEWLPLWNANMEYTATEEITALT